MVEKSFINKRRIYDFLFGKMLSRSKILILGFMFRKKIKKVKKIIKYKKVTYKGILHFVEIYEWLDKKINLE